MKLKSLCFTGEAGCLVYPTYRYSSLLKPALVTGKRLNYLPTDEGEDERGRKKQREREAFHTKDEIFKLFFLGYEQGKINDPWALDRGADYKGKGHPGIQ